MSIRLQLRTLGNAFVMSLAWLLFCTAALAGETTPPALLLANLWRDSLDVRDYLVSEKLDGVRAYWDGSTLRFRSGRPVDAPAWFTNSLPAVPLDGELWLGRDSFDELSAIVRRVPADDNDWRRIRYMVFDSPHAPGGFAERLARLHRHFDGVTANMPWLQLVEQFSLTDNRALYRKLQEVLKLKGEGLMLHRADAPYRSGRNDDLLKLKPTLDTEATVIGHEPGKGRLHGKTGALIMQMPAAQGGHIFRLASGLTDRLREQPPPIGSVVTYRFTSLTKRGVPRFPRFWRVREVF